jgi:hypothetical protein
LTLAYQMLSNFDQSFLLSNTIPAVSRIGLSQDVVNVTRASLAEHFHNDMLGHRPSADYSGAGAVRFAQPAPDLVFAGGMTITASKGASDWNFLRPAKIETK